MNSVQKRIGGQFPTVYITFLSVVIGLALEGWVSILSTTPQLFTITFKSTILWLQMFQNLLFIIVAWVAYTQIAMVRRSIPSPFDAIQVLGFTLTLFLLNAAIGHSLALYNYAWAAYLLIGGLATYFAVGQLKGEGKEFETYVSKIQSWRGPLALNAGGGLVCVGFGLGLEYDLVPPELQIIVLIIGATGVIMWMVIMHRIWRTHLVDAIN
ncbi:MAG: hypothetical protein V7709_10955 [Halioglobus sp.]